MTTTCQPSLPDAQRSRSAILGALRAAAPAQPLPRPSLAAYHQGPFGRGCVGPRIDPASLVDGFTQAARGWRAEVLLTGIDGWSDVVLAAVQRRACRQLAVTRRGQGTDGQGTDRQGTDRQGTDGLRAALAPIAAPAWAAQLTPTLAAAPGLHLHPLSTPIDANGPSRWKEALFDHVDAGISFAVAGVADTGSLVLIPGVDEPRTLSLVPPVHIAIVAVSQLYPSLPAAMQAALAVAQAGQTQSSAANRQTPPAMPTNLLLVTGPSKTADIQQVLAYGAHGPKELVIVLVDDVSVAAQAPSPVAVQAGGL